VRKAQSLKLSLKTETLTRLDLRSPAGGSTSFAACPPFTLPVNTYYPGQFTYTCPTGGHPDEN
jgi:hypothetical protein